MDNAEIQRLADMFKAEPDRRQHIAVRRLNVKSMDAAVKAPHDSGYTWPIDWDKEILELAAETDRVRRADHLARLLGCVDGLAESEGEVTAGSVADNKRLARALALLDEANVLLRHHSPAMFPGHELSIVNATIKHARIALRSHIEDVDLDSANERAAAFMGATAKAEPSAGGESAAGIA